MAPGQAISLNLAPADVAGYARQGNDLVITLVDGQVIVLDGAFVGQAMQADLYLSAQGQLLRVTTGVTQGPLEVAYDIGDGAGKWAANNVLYHMAEAEPVVAPAPDPDGAEAGMLASGLLAGIGAVTSGGVGTAAAVGAGLVGGGALLASGRDALTDPTRLGITQGTEASGKVINEDTLGNAHLVTGTGDPGVSVVVTIGDAQTSTVVGEDGSWSVPVPGPLAPGTYVVQMGGQQATDQLLVDTELSVGFDGARRLRSRSRPRAARP